MPMSRAKRISSCSTSRYFLRVAGGLALVNHSNFGKASHHVLIKNSVTFHADVAQEVAGFLVTQTLDSLLLGQPVAPFERIGKAAQTFSQRHAAVRVEVVARDHDVTRSGYRKTMRASSSSVPQSSPRVAVKQQRPNRVNRIQSHARGGACSEDAVGQFFPEPSVRAFSPNFLKLTKPLANLFASRSVSGHHSFNCDGFLVALHCSLSMWRFYEPAGSMSTTSVSATDSTDNADHFFPI